jgi:hypothetical protein
VNQFCKARHVEWCMEMGTTGETPRDPSCLTIKERDHTFSKVAAEKGGVLTVASSLLRLE